MSNTRNIIHNALRNEWVRRGIIAAATVYTAGAAGAAGNVGAMNGASMTPAVGVPAGAAPSLTPIGIAGGAAGGAVAEKVLPPAATAADENGDPDLTPTTPTTPTTPVSNPVQAERRRKKELTGRAGTLLTGGSYGNSTQLGDSGGRSNLLGR